MSGMRPRDVLLATIIVLGFVIHEVGADWHTHTQGLHVAIAIGGLLVVLVAVSTMIYDRVAKQRIDDEAHEAIIRQPALARFLFHDTRSAPLWLAVRLYIGLAWLTAGFAKLTGNPSWLRSGAPLKGFWANAVSVQKSGKSAIAYDWYHNFLQFMLDHQWYTWFAKLICLGELLVGIGLIVGGLTGVAAFFGALMNMSYLLAGSASTNPVIFTLAILVMMAWQVAGYWGIDRFALPVLGAPWSPGFALHHQHHEPQMQEPALEARGD